MWVHPTQVDSTCVTTSFCEAGRGFNNLSLVNMARHVPTGQLVALKHTNLDECTEEELLQLMVRHVNERVSLV